jgi:LysM repeat protein
MNRMSWRAALLLTLGVLVAMISAGCTLSGATQAPPPDTQVGPSSVTQATLPTTQAPIIASPTKILVVGSPTPVPTFDTFATLTAGPQTGPAGGVTPGSGVGVPTSSVGVVTPTKQASGGGATSTKAPVASGGGGAGGCPSTYTVQSGDNLFRIALRFNLTVAQLAAANGIANPNVIIVGTILKIPGCGTTPASSGGANPTPIPGTTGTVKAQPGDTVATNGDILHTVKSGENLYRIALTYGLSWQAVATYNGLTSPDQLVVGQVVHIPTK